MRFLPKTSLRSLFWNNLIEIFNEKKNFVRAQSPLVARLSGTSVLDCSDGNKLLADNNIISNLTVCLHRVLTVSTG